jgi:hypothetical protein
MSPDRVLRLSRLLLFLFAVAISPWPATAQSPQHITIRYIDYRSGKPLRGAHLGYYFWNGDQRPLVRGAVSTATGEDGEVTVTLPDPLPAHLSVFCVGEDIQNAAYLDVVPTEILKSGTVVPYPRDKNMSKLKTRISAKPGEVFVLARRFTGWDWFLQGLP